MMMGNNFLVGLCFLCLIQICQGSTEQGPTPGSEASTPPITPIPKSTTTEQGPTPGSEASTPPITPIPKSTTTEQGPTPGSEASTPPITPIPKSTTTEQGPTPGSEASTPPVTPIPKSTTTGKGSEHDKGTLEAPSTLNQTEKKHVAENVAFSCPTTAILGDMLKWIKIDSRNSSITKVIAIEKEVHVSNDKKDRYKVNLEKEDDQEMYTLTITDVQPEDDGSYKCIWVRDSNTLYEKITDLIVIQPVKSVELLLGGKKVNDSREPVVITLLKPDNEFSIKCAASGSNPKPNVEVKINELSITGKMSREELLTPRRQDLPSVRSYNTTLDAIFPLHEVTKEMEISCTAWVEGDTSKPIVKKATVQFKTVEGSPPATSNQTPKQPPAPTSKGPVKVEGSPPAPGNQTLKQPPAATSKGPVKVEGSPPAPGNQTTKQPPAPTSKGPVKVEGSPPAPGDQTTKQPPAPTSKGPVKGTLTEKTSTPGSPTPKTSTNPSSKTAVKEANKNPNDNDGSEEVPEPVNDENQETETLKNDKHSVEDEEVSSSGHFLAYFLTACVICIAGYVVFHNKQKIVAFIVEGRGQKGSRRSRNGDYKLLQSNVEEAVADLDKSVTKNYIY